MAEADVCQSCGMPMETPEMHGGGVKENPYCIYCTDAQGRLKSRVEVREGMIQFFVDTVGQSRQEAEQAVDATMGEMPAWQEEE